MARPTSATWTDITGDASTFAYRPLYGTGDVVYRSDEVSQAAGANQAFRHKPYKVLRVAFATNSSGVALDQDGAAIAADVASQATAPWLYDLKEIKAGETIATASGPEVRGIRESYCKTLADIKTLIGTEVGDWTSPV